MPGSRQHKTVIRISAGGDLGATGIAKAKKAWDTFLENREYDKNVVYGYLTVVFDLGPVFS